MIYTKKYYNCTMGGWEIIASISKTIYHHPSGRSSSPLPIGRFRVKARCPVIRGNRGIVDVGVILQAMMLILVGGWRQRWRKDTWGNRIGCCYHWCCIHTDVGHITEDVLLLIDGQRRLHLLAGLFHNAILNLHPLGFVAAILEPYLHLGRGEIQMAGEMFTFRCRQIPLLTESAFEFQHLGLREENSRFPLRSQLSILPQLTSRRGHQLRITAVFYREKGKGQKK